MVTEQFVLNKPVVTKDPLVQVDPKTIAAGKHVFQLTVQDNDGNVSAIAQQTVSVVGGARPGFVGPGGSITSAGVTEPGQPPPVVRPETPVVPAPATPSAPVGPRVVPDIVKPEGTAEDSPGPPTSQPASKPGGIRPRIKKRPDGSQNN